MVRVESFQAHLCMRAAPDDRDSRHQVKPPWAALHAYSSGWSITQNSLPSGSRMTRKSAPSG
jgi:hypothetical protein